MKIFSIAVIVVLMLGGELARGQSAPAAEPEPATLRFQNRDIVTLRSMRGLFSPRDRVDNAERRLYDLLRTSGAEEVHVVMVEGTSAVAMGSTVIFGLLPGDIEPGLTGP